jgi:hypothetical protein
MLYDVYLDNDNKEQDQLENIQRNFLVINVQHLMILKQLIYIIILNLHDRLNDLHHLHQNNHLNQIDHLD